MAKSHPSWVRGLKHRLYTHHRKSPFVAPLVGAWIETDDDNARLIRFARRTPRGCVD